MILRFLTFCLALSAWAPPAVADLYRNDATYQFTLKYFDSISRQSLVDTSGDITLTFSAQVNIYNPAGHSPGGGPANTVTDRIDEYGGGSLHVEAGPPSGTDCTYLGPDIIGVDSGAPDVSHSCPYTGTSRPFKATFTGQYEGYFLLQVVAADLGGCGCGDLFAFDQQLYFPPIDGENGYFTTGTFHTVGEGDDGSLTIALVDPTSPGGGGGDPTGPTGTNPTGPDANPVPEPAGWALMVGGLGLIGATRRRQKRAAG